MTQAGTLTVSLEVAEVVQSRQAKVGTVGAGAWIVLRVADQGAGMTPEILERIFDPFFTTKEMGVGTGLGLSLVLRIVTQAAGAIDVQSTPGVGSVFTVYLPRAGEAPEESLDDGPAPRGRGTAGDGRGRRGGAAGAHDGRAAGAGLRAGRVRVGASGTGGVSLEPRRLRRADHRPAHAGHVRRRAHSRSPATAPVAACHPGQRLRGRRRRRAFEQRLGRRGADQAAAGQRARDEPGATAGHRVSLRPGRAWPLR